MVAAIMAIGFAGSQYSQTTGALVGKPRVATRPAVVATPTTTKICKRWSAPKPEPWKVHRCRMRSKMPRLSCSARGTAGQAMEGQPLLRLLEPNPAALARLVELGVRRRNFKPRWILPTMAALRWWRLLPGYPQ